MFSNKYVKKRIKTSNATEYFKYEQEAQNSYYDRLAKEDLSEYDYKYDKDFPADREFLLCVEDKDKGTRLDQYIVENRKDLTRSQVKKLIDDDLVQVNDKSIKANYKVRTEDIIRVTLPKEEINKVEAENIPLNVIYEDDDIIVINKEKGTVVHPANGHYSRTLVNGLLYHYKDNLSTINGELRPGIVHRLDMDTTGTLVVCKNNFAHMALAKQFKDHSVVRKYHAIVYNVFKEAEGTIDAPIGRNPVNRKRMSINYENGKSAITHYKLINNLKDNFAYVECSLETGRTHQIRVHMASINHPVLGDDVYGPKNKRFKLEGQALHAKVVGFIHPRSNKYMEFESPLPDYFTKILNRLS
ncbi:MAG: RluA family pseudouridine synthase [Clostridiales bacterium]|nr:RluA family pseudouridine synthase [Clostridiales bacterium]